ncbi:tRNA(Ile)(2)-agmatinylcytidine synthase [Saccharolobus shibatae]|uniref:tRNA(Ile2) 2-agmatinylcytidine synthetase TiaS n=1 Tax=Saccharolobus shibatae TaxID=2286 RepID=A0A8F5BY11_9CREN|nr:tRNA(Ile)(2)-agmatinylcytidine synthase [Saccharolobus shibatae]QXJ33470.1 tRNA(Ile)(2)-agmatinylcytidine synthase [Saccharolobus shibatae]
MKYIIGIDDHDSYKFGCTTHFSVILTSYLYKNHNTILLDLPYLVRLNPNIPWKTRGNASIKLVVDFNGTKKELADIIFSYSLKYVKDVSLALEHGRKPGIAIIEYDKYKTSFEKLYNFYIKGLSDIIPIDYAKKFAEKNDIEIRGDRGIIGSIAALGVSGDYTYELITYRKKENWFKKRMINEDSVKRVDEETFPLTFANYDYINDSPLITPHGSDPILYGIRGTSIEHLIKAMGLIESNEDINFFAIFKTNQNTDIHFQKVGNRFYQQIKKVIQIKNIKILEGGDVMIRTTDDDILFVYKETGELNSASKLLKEGDEIVAYGAIKPSIAYGKIIELERFEILKLNDLQLVNPKCPICGGSTKSLGKNKGYKCKKCKYIINTANKSMKNIIRNLSLGIYQTRAYRHLTRPIFLTLEKNNQSFHEERKFLDMYRSELYKLDYNL